MVTANAVTCPVSHDFELLTTANLADPYPLLARKQAETPVFYSAELGMWVVTRYGEIESILRDPVRFSAAIALDPVYPIEADAAGVLDAGFAPAPTMASADPPKHTRIRRHTARAFSARRLAKLEPVIHDRAIQLIDAMMPAGRSDLVADLAFPLPATVIFALIGFPPEDTEKIKAWCGTRVDFTWGRTDPDEQVQIARNMLAYWRYCQAFVAERLADPADDLISDLLRTHLSDSSQLSVDEITNVAYGLSFAGHETTTNLIANLVHRLLTHRRQWDRLCTDPSRIPGAVEEALRFDTSVVGWRRLTTQPVTVGGVDVPAAAKLLLLLGAAGRDPRIFEDPETFDITRPNARTHLAFGKGIHFCLGAPLARMEAAIVVELLANRLPTLRLVPGRQIDYHANISFRGPRQLWVEWD